MYRNPIITYLNILFITNTLFMNKKTIKSSIKSLLWGGIISIAFASCHSEKNVDNKGTSESTETNINPTDTNAGLSLPEGFSAVKIGDSLGEARHIAVTSNGGIYIKLRSLKEGKGIIYLKDTNEDGIFDLQESFGDYIGTGIYVSDEYLYASSDQSIFRYALDENQKVLNPENPDTLVENLIDRRQHGTKSFTLDQQGHIYVNIGAYSNACQEQDRTQGSSGMMPCPILDSAGGIWQFSTEKMHQSYAEGKRYATGLRNVVGLDWNEKNNALFVMQHGRDQLHMLYPDLYTAEESAALPAETMYRLEEGDDAGWPYVYYDQLQHKKIVAPEYGGDGKKTGGESALDPLIAFPGHLAPNALLFYTGNLFPEKYKNGAFIAFHGSWNRSPEEQEGFLVAFVPFKEGKPSGEWEVFADGFAGVEKVISPDEAKHRPCGLAQGPDGALYVSDDAGGALFKITYQQ